MKRYISIIGIILFYTFSATAQNDVDAMRYSRLTFGGTARFASMAGSMGALGGDFSTLSFNPAGIAIFKKTELSITPSFFYQSTSSTYNGLNSSNSKLNVNLGNIGIVATFNLNQTKNNSGWESLNFGFGYNRTNNFHNRILTEGDNTKSSMLDAFVHDANGHSDSDFDQFSTNLAWQTWLINPADTSGNLIYNHVIPNYGEHQRKKTTTSGSTGETVISFGGNYKSKVYVGATLGIVNERFTDETIYEETDETDTINNFKSFKYTSDLTTKGNGFNLKVGMIVKVTDWLRIGGAVHTPTAFSLKDEYSNEMSSDLDGVSYDTVSPQGSFDYRLITPWKAIGSIGFVIKKIALLNVDYEYVDYSFAQLNSHPDYFSDVNTMIHSKYTSTSNLRIGGEVRLDPLAFRLGYALYGSPFSNGDNKNAARSSYTAGIGFRQNNYFFDFAYVLTKSKEYNYLYDGAPTSAENNYKNSSFMLTMGLRF
jgi:hypothetical protein